MSDEQDIAADVERVGWSAISIYDASPPFVYTVGLMFSLAHPELIVFGLGDEGYSVLRVMVEELRGGRSFAAQGAFQGVLEHGSIATRPVHQSQHETYLGSAMGYCRERGRMAELEAVQVFWPDSSGRFPFERECDEAVWAAQPRLDLPVWPDGLRESRRSMDE